MTRGRATARPVTCWAISASARTSATARRTCAGRSRACASMASTVEAVSSLYETEPVGEILDQPDFLNAAVRIRTALEPEALLDALQGDRGGARPRPRRAAPRAAPDRHRPAAARRHRAAHRAPHPSPPGGHVEALRAACRCSSSIRSSACPTAPVSQAALEALGESQRVERVARRRARHASPASHSAGRPGGVRPGKSGTSRFASSPQGLGLDERPQVVEAHQQPDARCDLEVGGVRLRAADHPVRDPGVDPVEVAGRAARSARTFASVGPVAAGPRRPRSDRPS